MRSEEYEYLDSLEDRMWWFKGLRGNVVNILSRNVAGRFSLLDAGCGTGGMLSTLAQRFPGTSLCGIDFSADACERSKLKSFAEIKCGSVTALPYNDKTFDVITCLDVLEYDSVDVIAALQEFRRVLKNNGLLLLNLPAYQWMLSYHDVAVGQSKRFTRNDFKRELAQQGYKVSFATYWNTIFFPLMVLRRKIFVRRDGGSDVKPFPEFIERIFRFAIGLEQTVIKNRLPMPFGGSVMILAEKIN